MAGQMKTQADMQAAKYAELGRERDVLLKMRNKAEDSTHHQVRLGQPAQEHCLQVGQLQMSRQIEGV